MKLSMKQFLYLLSLVLIFTACNDETSEPQLNVPTTYESLGYDLNVTAERLVRTELGNLVGDLNTAEANAIASTNSSAITYPGNLESVTLPAFRTEVENWLSELVKAANSGQAFDLENAPNGEGGILGTRLLDENGLELEQLIDKGSFGAALYNHALTVMSGNLSEISIDRLVEIYGAHPSFPGDDADPNNPDTFSAEYAERRSDHVNGTGLYYDIRDNLILAKAAIAAGDNFNNTRDQALSDFKLNWEKSNFATVIYYCNDAREKIVAANNESDSTAKNTLLGNAMHSYAEAVAFAYGWRGINDKLISDSQIDTILERLLVVPGGSVESYRFAKEADLLSRFQDVIDQIQSVYGFTETEVNGFFINN